MDCSAAALVPERLQAQLGELQSEVNRIDELQQAQAVRARRVPGTAGAEPVELGHETPELSGQQEQQASAGSLLQGLTPEALRAELAEIRRETAQLGDQQEEQALAIRSLQGLKAEIA